MVTPLEQEFEPLLAMLDPFTRMDRALQRILEQDLERVAAGDRPKAPLYHYTDRKAFRSILRTPILRATRFDFLNDATEMSLGEGAVFRVLSALAVVGRPVLRDLCWRLRSIYTANALSSVAPIYVCSFTENGDLLSQWRAYGDGGFGYSLGFSVLEIPTVDESDATCGVAIVRCIYDEAEFCHLVVAEFSRVAEALERLLCSAACPESKVAQLERTTLTHLLCLAGALSPRLKHGGFSEEAEWRVVAIQLEDRGGDETRYRGEGRARTPFIELPLAARGARPEVHEIVVGPCRTEEDLQSDRDFVVSCGLRQEVLKRSAIPLRRSAGKP